MRMNNAPDAPGLGLVAGDVPVPETGEAASSVVIRPMRRRDVPGFVALRRHLWADAVITAESFAWTLDREPVAEQARRWVATRRGRVVGIAEANRAPWSPAEVSLCHVGVEAALRGRGIGRRLFAEAERHLARIGADQTRARIESADERSMRFADHRGFHVARDHRTWSLDPRSVSLADLPRRLADAEAAGLRLAPVRALLDRPRDLYDLSVAVLGDVPAANSNQRGPLFPQNLKRSIHLV